MWMCNPPQPPSHCFVACKRWPVTRLAVGNLARSPARTAGTAISVLVGIGLVMLTTVFASSFDANVSTSVRKLYKADATLAGASEIPGVPRANLDAVDGAFGVRTATPVRTGGRCAGRLRALCAAARARPVPGFRSAPARPGR